MLATVINVLFVIFLWEYGKFQARYVFKHV
nr:MAG TPA: hypothetical protein [Caudoviricetes sp.]